MIGRIVGALIRAVLVIATFILPSAVLPSTSDDLVLLTLLVALFMGALTFAEYVSSSPSLIEFRFAPPYNAIRFATLVFLLALTIGVMQTPTNEAMRLIASIAKALSQVLDFPGSPLHYLPKGLGDDATPAQATILKQAGAMTFIVALAMVGLFWALSRGNHWPDTRQPFNLWTNMPTFYCASDADIGHKLRRDAVANVILGLLLIYVFPFAASLLSNAFVSLRFDTALPMTWMVVAWAFLPTGLLMRAIAIVKISRDLDRIKAAQSSQADGLPA